MQGQPHGRHLRYRPVAAAETATWAGAALRSTRRITYRFTGSPATRITGESMMISGHMARQMAAWVTGPGCLIQPG